MAQTTENLNVCFGKEPDMVNHPQHYISKTGLEVIDVIEAFTFDLKGIEATDTGNIIKYICRWKQKNGLQDLKKAQWYLQHLIDHVESEEKKRKEIHNTVFGDKAFDTHTDDALDSLRNVVDLMLNKKEEKESN